MAIEKFVKSLLFFPLTVFIHSHLQAFFESTSLTLISMCFVHNTSTGSSLTPVWKMEIERLFSNKRENKTKKNGLNEKKKNFRDWWQIKCKGGLSQQEKKMYQVVFCLIWDSLQSNSKAATIKFTFLLEKPTVQQKLWLRTYKYILIVCTLAIFSSVFPRKSRQSFRFENWLWMRTGNFGMSCGKQFDFNFG